MTLLLDMQEHKLVRMNDFRTKRGRDAAPCPYPIAGHASAALLHCEMRRTRIDLGAVRAFAGRFQAKPEAPARAGPLPPAPSPVAAAVAVPGASARRVTHCGGARAAASGRQRPLLQGRCLHQRLTRHVMRGRCSHGRLHKHTNGRHSWICSFLGVASYSIISQPAYSSRPALVLVPSVNLCRHHPLAPTAATRIEHQARRVAER